MKKFLSSVLVFLLGVGLSSAIVLHVVQRREKNSLQYDKGDNVSDTYERPPMRKYDEKIIGTTDFTRAAELSVDAVVHVTTAYQNQYVINPWFEFFFGRPQQLDMPMQKASGSGVIISSDGYIVTNNHVIEKADYIKVALNDKREFQAQLVGVDPSTDIALLKIEASDLPCIAMGNSDDLQIGEWVLAVGNPFNLTSTVTAGIVSAKARNINILNSEMKIESFIQTDAAVNPGNSGGALVNTKGELVGINTAIASQTGSYTGYSFAIPTSIVEKVVNDLKTFGKVQRALLGAHIMEITPELKQSQNLSTLNGAYIYSVLPNGAADLAGLKSGDVIIKIDNTPIKTATNLQEQIGRHHPGDHITLTFVRNDHTYQTNVELTNTNGKTPQTRIQNKQENNILGATFTPVNPIIKKKLHLNNGMQIAKLGNGKLKDAGITQGSIIVKINNQTVRTENDITDAITNAQNNNMNKISIQVCSQQGFLKTFFVHLDD